MTDEFRKLAYFFAMVFVALSLGPSLAHLLELPNKIALSRDDYFTVQTIYQGWALLGVLVFVSLLATLTLTISLRGDRTPMVLAGLAFLCVVGTQVVFWVFTFPANQATSNWTEIPENWEQLRVQWEYSHAVAALLNLIAMVSLIGSLLSWKERR